MAIHAIHASDGGGEVQFTARTGETWKSGQVVELPDGRAGVIASGNDRVAADEVAAFTRGQFTCLKNTSAVILEGQHVWWDWANEEVQHSSVGAGATGFPLGIALANATAAATTVRVQLNDRVLAKIHQDRGQWGSITVLTAGTPSTVKLGGGSRLSFSATAEAQKVDLISDESIAIVDGMVFEAVVNVRDNGDHAALDLNIGLANATHATDADSITNSAFIHIDGNDLNIFAETDDTADEIAATNTTVDYVVGTAFFIQIRVNEDETVDFFINGVAVLTSTLFTLLGAAGPMKALVHLEKTSNDTPGSVDVTDMWLRPLRRWVAVS